MSLVNIYINNEPDMTNIDPAFCVWLLWVLNLMEVHIVHKITLPRLLFIQYLLPL